MAADPLAECETLFARSRVNSPGPGLVWTLLVSDALVQAAEGWSGPVQFKFEKMEDGRVEMWLRTFLPEPECKAVLRTLEARMRSEAGTFHELLRRAHRRLSDA